MANRNTKRKRDAAAKQLAANKRANPNYKQSNPPSKRTSKWEGLTSGKTVKSV